MIDETKLNIFKNGNSNNELEERDMSLFQLWQNTKQQLDSMSFSPNPPANQSFEDMDNMQTETSTPVAIDESAPDSCKAGPPSASAEIPSPFKRHLFYERNSEEQKEKKRSAKEKMPAIISGRLCQEYFKRRVSKKKELERRKLERAAERRRKRDEKEKDKQDKSQKRRTKKVKRVLRYEESSDSSIDDEISYGSGSNDESKEEDLQVQDNNLTVERKVGEYVVFSYEKELFPGVIIAVSEATATISAMEKCGRLWKWPERMDKLDYEWEAVLYRINEPIKMSTTRNVYSVTELS